MQLRGQAGPTLDGTPFQCRATHTPQPGTMKTCQSPHVYIFGMWEETEAPRENSCRHGETYQLNTDSDSTQEPKIFFLINIVIRQC